MPGLLAAMLVLGEVVTPVPGLVFETTRPYGFMQIRWHGRQLFPPPGGIDPNVDHIAAGHSNWLRLVGEWNAEGLHRWVFSASGIDDCNSYGVWVLDVRDGHATMRRIVRSCIFFGVEILSWKPRARVLVTTNVYDPSVYGSFRPLRLAFDLDP